MYAESGNMVIAAMTIIEPREQRFLRSVEQHTKAKITVSPVPSLGDLLAKRLERTKAAIQETLEAGELEDFRRVVQALAGSADPADIAAAAVKLVWGPRSGYRAGVCGCRAGGRHPARRSGRRHCE